MSTRRTALAAGLLLLAGAMAAPALIGPLLLPDPPVELITPRASRLSPPDDPGAVAGTSGTRELPRRIGIAPRAGGAATLPAAPADTSAMDVGDPGAPGGRLEGTIVAGRTFPYTAAPGGAYSAGTSRSRVMSGSAGFGGIASYTGSTPGLLGWGLSDKGGSAAGVEMPAESGGTSRLTTAPSGGATPALIAGGSGSAAGGSSSGSSSGGSSGGSDDSSSSPGSGGGSGDSTGDSGETSSLTSAPPAPPPGGDAASGDDGGVLSGLGITPEGDGSGDEGSSLTPGGGGGSMPAPNPEPATLLLVGGGAALAGLYRRARRRSR